MTGERTAIRTCPLCEATCGLELQIVDDRVTRIRGDRKDVFSKGFLCPKGTTLGAFHDDPDRLRTPMVRRNGVHEPASWDDAFSEIAARLEGGSDRSQSAIYLGNPVVHSLDASLFGRALITGMGTRMVFSASTVDQRPREVASGLIYGQSTTIPVPDIDRTDCLVILGANPVVSNGSLATAPDWPGRIDALRERGGTLIVVDPIRTATAERANHHLAIRPNTDPLLLAALANEIVGRGVDRPDPADAEALHAVAAALGAFTIAAVAPQVGICEAELHALVDALVAADRPCLYGRLGTTITPFGTTASWLIDIVNALLGALDAPGGAMFAMPATGGKNSRSSDPTGPVQQLGRRQTAVSKLPVELGEHPVAALSEEIEAGNIALLVTVAGNPVLSCPDSGRLDDALPAVDFMVSVDCYLNETTRHADVILPAPSHLQKGHYDIAFSTLAVRNIANWSPPVFPLADGDLAEWEILARLASLFGGGPATAEGARAVDELAFGQVAAASCQREGAPEDLTVERIAEATAGRAGPERLLDVLLRSGPYGDWFDAAAGGLSLAELEANPHGVDLGPLESRLPAALTTPSGRPEFAHPDLMADLERLRATLHTPANGDLVLVNRRTLRSNNSWMHNLRVLVKGRPRCTAWVHPADAERAGVNEGDRVELRSVVGSIALPAEITDVVREGVVSVPHGWGHGAPGTAMQVAAEHAGANVNVLTPTDVVDPLSGTSQLTGFPVSVTVLAS